MEWQAMALLGAYHGINDEEIARATKTGKSVPAAAGIPPESVAKVVVLGP